MAITPSSSSPLRDTNVYAPVSTAIIVKAKALIRLVLVDFMACGFYTVRHVSMASS